MVDESLSYAAGPDQPPVLDMTVGDLLRSAARRAPDRYAIVEGIADRAARRRWTYAELLRDAEACARALVARYPVGSHIGVWAPNIPEWTLFQCGAALAGMVIVTVNPTFREREVRFSLEQSGAVACFVHPEFRGSPTLEIAGRIRDAVPALQDVHSFADFEAFLAGADSSVPLPEVDPLGAAQIQYTSGTTGTPKGAGLGPPSTRRGRGPGRRRRTSSPRSGAWRSRRSPGRPTDGPNPGSPAGWPRPRSARPARPR